MSGFINLKPLAVIVERVKLSAWKIFVPQFVQQRITNTRCGHTAAPSDDFTSLEIHSVFLREGIRVKKQKCDKQDANNCAFCFHVYTFMLRN
jgi:hypothetical protein